MNKNLNKVALVTGGSKGLGRAICLRLAQEGMDIAFSYSKSEEAAETTKAEVLKIGARCLKFKCSVLDSHKIVKMVKEIVESFGKIDILVNNAGVTQIMPFPMIEEEDWDHVMDTNVKGTYLVTHAVVRNMIKNKKGKILNISSLAGVKLIRAPVHYATSKAALEGFTKALSKEVARYNIHVNSLAPGLLDFGVGSHLNDEQLADYLKHCSLGRAGTAEEIANLAAFMVSDHCSYLSGTTILADGGL